MVRHIQTCLCINSGNMDEPCHLKNQRVNGTTYSGLLCEHSCDTDEIMSQNTRGVNSSEKNSR